MEVQNKSVEEHGKIFKQLGDDQREIKSQLTKLTNSLTTQDQGILPSQSKLNPTQVLKTLRVLMP